VSLLTLSQVQKGPASRVSGLVPSSQDFRNYVNDATRQLMRRASWWSTVQPMEGCIRNRYITWPRRVASVLAVNVCGRPMDVKNFWYRFLNYDLTYGRQDWWMWRDHFALEMDGTIPVYNPVVCSTGMVLLFYPSDPSDVGKTITIYGIDFNGQALRMQRPDGTIQDGLQVTLAVPFGSTQIPIRKVDRVVKDVTNFPVRGYQWDGVALNSNGTPAVLDLAYYEAGETNPEYIHARFGGNCFGNNISCATQQPCQAIKITALVKLAFVPVMYPDDLVLIENQDALRDMIISIRKKEAGDMATSVMYEKSAIRELNYETYQRWPWEQTNVSFRPFGHDSLNQRLVAVNRG
jgi:hypothetical protein